MITTTLISKDNTEGIKRGIKRNPLLGLWNPLVHHWRPLVRLRSFSWPISRNFATFCDHFRDVLRVTAKTSRRIFSYVAKGREKSRHFVTYEKIRREVFAVTRKKSRKWTSCSNIVTGDLWISCGISYCTNRPLWFVVGDHTSAATAWPLYPWGNIGCSKGWCLCRLRNLFRCQRQWFCCRLRWRSY